MTVRVTFHARGTAEDDRALLATEVALALGCSPAEVTVIRRCDHCGGTDHGRPDVVAPAPASASLSRAGSLVAVAVASDGVVGVDITALDAVAVADFDDVALTAAERVRVAASLDPTLLRAELWTRKEALLKATGTGLRVDPALVGFGDDGQLAEWLAPGVRPEAVVVAIDPGEGYIGAVVLVSAGTGTE